MSYLVKANKKYREGDLIGALEFYEKAIEENPMLEKVVKANISRIHKIIGLDGAESLVVGSYTNSKVLERLDQCYKKYIHKLAIDNEKESESYSKVKEKASLKKLKVMVGTLYSGENEFNDSVRAVNNQSYKIDQHLIIKNKSNVEAHNLLYKSFSESNCDILLKIDADMVIIDEGLVDKVVKIILWSSGIAIVQMAILDYYSGGIIQGVNAYTKLFKWYSEKTDNVFTDRASTNFDKKSVVWGLFQRSVIHSPNPSMFQAFHFGVHRAIKVLEANKRGDLASANEQLNYLIRTYNHYLLRKTNNLFFASVGAFLGLSGKFTISEIDYTNPELENYFYSNIKSLAGKEEYLSELVKQFKINNGCFLDGFKDRNYIVKRVCFLLPHVKTFGGVFRFLEISKSFYYLGIDAFIAIIDSDWNDADVISIQKSFPEARIIRLSEAIDQSWDVVVCGDFSSGLFLLLPYFNSKLTCAYLLNGWQHRYINIEQLKLVRPELVVANSSYAAEHYPELAPVVIPGGINMETFGSERFVIKKHLSEINILVPVGRKKPRKRFFDALDACKMLSEKYKINMHTIDAENLEDFSDEKLSHFHHYNLSREQVSELISRMDIAVFPEEDAGWNNPAAEAMAIGCPLVCTSAGTTDFAINGVTAFVVEPRNPKAIYTACEKLIESYEIRKMMSEKGKEIIKNYTWYNVTKKLLDLFEVSINSISAYRESTGSAVKKKLEKKLGV